VMHLMEESLNNYSYMPIILVEMILWLDGLSSNPASDLRDNPHRLQVKLQTFSCPILFHSLDGDFNLYLLIL